MALRSINAKFQVVAAGTGAATSVTSASTVGVGDLTIDESRAVTEIASRGINCKRALVGLATCVIGGSCEADASALSVLRTAHRNATDVYAKLTWADGSAVAGQFAVTKLDSDAPVEGEERWNFELQPSATATPDSSGDVLTYSAAPSSGSGSGGGSGDA